MAAAWTPERSVAGKRNPWTIIGVISIATFMVVLDTSIANVALAHIAGNLSASYDEATWVITSFLIANAVIIPISGWLADVLGRKRFYMISVALFTGASLLCGMAPSLSFLILARILQGIGGGGLAPVEQSMMVDTFPPEKRGPAFALYGIVVIVGPIVGPTLGGWLTDSYSWHWVFLINVPIGLLSLFLVSLYVEEPKLLIEERAHNLKTKGLHFDAVGFALVALFLGCLEITLDRGQRDDWFSSPLIASTAVICVIAFIAFIPWELRSRDPAVRIDLYGQRNFLISNVFMLLMGVVVFGSTQFIPQLLQQVLGYTATEAGLAMTVGGVATLIAMPLSGILTGKVDARWLIGFSLVVQGIAFWNMATLNTDISFWQGSYARMIQAIGLPFMFVPITNAAYVGLNPRDNNQASALLNVSRNLGGTIGIALSQTMLEQRSQVHQSQFTELLNGLNPNYTHGIQQMQHGLVAQGLSAAQAGQAANAELYGELQKQAAMLSYLDVFHVLLWIVILTFPLVFLMRSATAGKGEAAI
jgi:DHA2 family multidrug resistance protein